MRPDNTRYVRAGDAVHLKCRTDLSKPVHWQHGEDNNQSHMFVVYDDGDVYDDILALFHKERLTIQPLDGWYNLTINHVSYADAGVYVCIDNNGLPGTNDKAFVELVVIGKLLKR